MAKLQGSEIFGTNTMPTDDYILMATVIKEQNPDATAVDIDADIRMIDDMLSMQRIHVISRVLTYTKAGYRRKDLTLMDFLDRRIGARLEEGGK